MEITFLNHTLTTAETEAHQAVKQARDSTREAERAGRPSTAPIYTEGEKWLNTTTLKPIKEV